MKNSTPKQRVGKCNCLCHFKTPPTPEQYAVSSYYGCQHCRTMKTNKIEDFDRVWNAYFLKNHPAYNAIKALLTSEVERIIGEDEELDMDSQCPYCRAMRWDCNCNYFGIRNQLRTEQRKALSELSVKK